MKKGIEDFINYMLYRPIQNVAPLRKTIGNDFFHSEAKSARIVFKIGAFLRRRLVNAWLKFKIAAWRFGVQLELELELELFFLKQV